MIAAAGLLRLLVSWSIALEWRGFDASMVVAVLFPAWAFPCNFSCVSFDCLASVTALSRFGFGRAAIPSAIDVVLCKVVFSGYRASVLQFGFIVVLVFLEIGNVDFHFFRACV